MVTVGMESWDRYWLKVLVQSFIINFRLIFFFLFLSFFFSLAAGYHAQHWYQGVFLRTKETVLNIQHSVYIEQTCEVVNYEITLIV